MEGPELTNLKRPTRNKRYNRKVAFECDIRRPPKRLFTPEIKRYLKDWLIRRRDNPYPNRDEKKTLAFQTGLTYIQVCNWFANWRRKLKNAGKEPQKKTWGHLIKSYNSQALGNVEHFSISSEDSIWRELEKDGDTEDEQFLGFPDPHDLYPYDNNDIKQLNANRIDGSFAKECRDMTKPSMISRWLESAAKFKPCERNYLYYYDNVGQGFNNNSKLLEQIHGREELDAAEALTKLANDMSPI